MTDLKCVSDHRVRHITTSGRHCSHNGHCALPTTAGFSNSCVTSLFINQQMNENEELLSLSRLIYILFISFLNWKHKMYAPALPGRKRDRRVRRNRLAWWRGKQGTLNLQASLRDDQKFHAKPQPCMSIERYFSIQAVINIRNTNNTITTNILTRPARGGVSHHSHIVAHITKVLGQSDTSVNWGLTGSHRHIRSVGNL
jgi:hypothetical protein